MLSWDANEAASLGMRSDPQLSAWNFYIGPVVVRDVNEVWCVECEVIKAARSGEKDGMK